MLDLKIINGTVVDGSGADPVVADIGVADGRIVSIGEVDDDATRTVDAEGHVVAPGFIDVHTHLDAQVLWDPCASPSSLHGMTTIIGGNCGFTLQPVVDESIPYLVSMLSRVEGIPLSALTEGVNVDWRSTGQYLDRLEGSLGVNAGFLVGHSAIRRTVMGSAANEAPASDAQLEEMKRLLAESLAAGGLGFSSSWSRTHNDSDGDMVPSRYGLDEELIALCGVVADYPGTSLEFTPPLAPFSQDVFELMAAMSAAANRHLNWGAVTVNAENREAVLSALAMSDYAKERGGKVVAQILAVPLEFWLNFETGFLFDSVPEWRPAMALPPAEKIALLSNPAERAKLLAWASTTGTNPGPLRAVFDWPTLQITETASPETAKYRGRFVGEIAAEEGKEPFDALMDIVVADHLKTVVYPVANGGSDADWIERAKWLGDDRTVVAASDAGAHLDFLAQFNFATVMLDNLVRNRGLLTVQEAVRLLSDKPAQLFGLKGRGRLARGYHADIVVFDLATVGSTPAEVRHDLPGGAYRMYAEAIGVDRVLVNGVEIVEQGKFTHAQPGQVLRSGRDTVTAAART